jgi:hypothetical protein
MYNPLNSPSTYPGTSSPLSEVHVTFPPCACPPLLHPAQAHPHCPPSTLWHSMHHTPNTAAHSINHTTLTTHHAHDPSLPGYVTHPCANPVGACMHAILPKVCHCLQHTRVLCPPAMPSLSAHIRHTPSSALGHNISGARRPCA